MNPAGVTNKPPKGANTSEFQNEARFFFEISNTDVDNNGGIGTMYLVEGFGGYLPSDDVVSLYDPADARLQTLTVDSILGGVYAPYGINKYPNVLGTDNTKVIRLVEVYLNRAEARAQIGTNISGAQDDLDMVRQRGLPTEQDATATGATLLDEILLERRLELAFEGHRHWDLMRYKEDIVRTQCAATICTIPYGTDTTILPIPEDETDFNPNIVQNPGYVN